MDSSRAEAQRDKTMMDKAGKKAKIGRGTPKAFGGGIRLQTPFPIPSPNAFGVVTRQPPPAFAPRSISPHGLPEFRGLQNASRKSGMVLVYLAR
jgi:hypothetical protein